MPSLSAFIAVVAIATVAAVAMAAIGQPALHMAVAAIAGAGIAFHAYREHSALIAAGASASAAGAATARNSALVWTWGALTILLTYTAVMANRWPEWWHFFLGFSLAAMVSLAFAGLLHRDAEAGRVDEPILKAGRALMLVQLAGVIAGVISMFADGKFPRAASHPDWAACNIFFFGALSVAAISIHALRSARKQ